MMQINRKLLEDWTKRMSTERLRQAFRSAMRSECECDGYHGFICGIHRRRDELRRAIALRELKRVKLTAALKENNNE